MANNFGTNPMVFDTTGYITGDLTATLGSRTLTGNGTTWTTTTHPSSPVTSNRDRVTEVSMDSGVTWYVVLSRDSATALTIEQPYQGSTSAGLTYLTRHRLIPRRKVTQVVWTNPTANDDLVFRDAGHNIKIAIRAGTVEQEIFTPAAPMWMDIIFMTLPSGTAYIYYE